MTTGLLVPKHPAKFSDPILPVLASYLEPGWRILDPFGGVGRVHELAQLVHQLHILAVELEPEWAHAHPGTWVGDALHLPAHFADLWDAIVTSPTYGNRFADSHNAQERCRACTKLRAAAGVAPGVHFDCEKCDGSGHRKHHRRGYTHNLGRKLTDGSSGAMQWGPVYRAFHEEWLQEAHRVIRPGTDDRPPGRLVLNMSDHMRGDDRQRVVEWWLGAAIDAGFEWIGATPIATKRMKDGSNADKRVPYEMVMCFEKVAA